MEKQKPGFGRAFVVLGSGIPWLPASGRHYHHRSIADDAPINHACHLLAEHRHILRLYPLLCR